MCSRLTIARIDCLQTVGNASDAAGRYQTKALRPARKRELVKDMMSAWQVSERRARCLMEVHRSTRQFKSVRSGHAYLKKRIKEISETPVRYGYRRIHVMLRRKGWPVNLQRVYLVSHVMGLQLRNKMLKRRCKVNLQDGRKESTALNAT